MRIIIIFITSKMFCFSRFKKLFFSIKLSMTYSKQFSKVYLCEQDETITFALCLIPPEFGNSQYSYFHDNIGICVSSIRIFSS